jgi:hypothetical protein
MNEKLISQVPENGGDKQGTTNNPADKETNAPKNKLRPSKRKACKNPRLTGFEWGGFFVDLYVTLWVWSDLVACQEIIRLAFLMATVFVAHGVLCYFISKIINSWRLAFVVWLVLGGAAAWISYKNCQPVPSTKLPPPPTNFRGSFATNIVGVFIDSNGVPTVTNIPLNSVTY